ncbi:MAG: patatin-like phospholipase family protein [Alphaproteobacteria bacterium]|nr:patatin-like phospholipase family protein [Alphaproteobacteria bacterium]
MIKNLCIHYLSMSFLFGQSIAWSMDLRDEVINDPSSDVAPTALTEHPNATKDQSETADSKMEDMCTSTYFLSRPPKQVETLPPEAFYGDDTVSSEASRLLERPWLPSLHVYGGGIRGIIPATVLREFEKLTGEQTIHTFDFFSGTSTGGIVIGAITAGIPARDVVKLYKKNDPTIFAPTMYFNPYGVRGPQYDINNLRSVLETFTKGRTLGYLHKDVLIPCFDVKGMKPQIFKSWSARLNESHNFWLTDVLSATAAAPTYFSPVQFHNYPYEPDHRNRREFIGVDGAIFDNASTSTAFNSIQELYGTDINHLAVALGTGKEAVVSPSYESLKEMGALALAPNLINWMITANVGKTEYEMPRYLKPIGNVQQYYEFNPIIDSDHAALDNTSPEILDQLEQYGMDLFENEDTDASIQKLLSRLDFIHENGLVAKKISEQR